MKRLDHCAFLLGLERNYGPDSHVRFPGWRADAAMPASTPMIANRSLPGLSIRPAKAHAQLSGGNFTAVEESDFFKQSLIGTTCRCCSLPGIGKVMPVDSAILQSHFPKQLGEIGFRRIGCCSSSISKLHALGQVKCRAALPVLRPDPPQDVEAHPCWLRGDHSRHRQSVAGQPTQGKHVAGSG